MNWSKIKIVKIHEYNKFNLDSSANRRHPYSPSIKKITKAAKHFCIDAIRHNSNFSTRKIINLLFESELEIIVNKRIITRTLNNLGYRKNLNLELRTMINKKWNV